MKKNRRPSKQHINKGRRPSSKPRGPHDPSNGEDCQTIEEFINDMLNTVLLDVLNSIPPDPNILVENADLDILSESLSSLDCPDFSDTLGNPASPKN